MMPRVTIETSIGNISRRDEPLGPLLYWCARAMVINLAVIGKTHYQPDYEGLVGQIPTKHFKPADSLV
jgi:hypothetical protein